MFFNVGSAGGSTTQYQPSPDPKALSQHHISSKVYKFWCVHLKYIIYRVNPPPGVVLPLLNVHFISSHQGLQEKFSVFPSLPLSKTSSGGCLCIWWKSIHKQLRERVPLIIWHQSYTINHYYGPSSMWMANNIWTMPQRMWEKYWKEIAWYNIKWQHGPTTSQRKKYMYEEVLAIDENFMVKVCYELDKI